MTVGLFFDVCPKPGHMPRYFEHVDRLKPALARHEGLLYLERFRPLDQAEALLSHQLWTDDAALARWRADPDHRVSQAAGRRVHFDSYRIRVAERIDDPAALSGKGRYLMVAHGPQPYLSAGARAYESVTRPGHFVTVHATDDPEDAREASSAALARGSEPPQLFLVWRDYGMTDRAEAPAP